MHRILINAFLFFLLSINFNNAFSQNANAYSKAGDKAFAKGDYNNAIYYYGQAHDLNNNDLEITYKLANAYRESKDYRRASSYYSTVVVDDKASKFPLAVFYLAETKKYMGLYESAKAFYRKYYEKRTTDDDFFSKKSRDEIIFCDSALLLMGNLIKVQIDNAGDHVNTEYSEFAAQMIGDSLLAFSSMRFPLETENGETKTASRILTAPYVNKNFREADEINGGINSLDVYNSASSISGDKKIMVFCRCLDNDTSNNLICQLFESINKNGIWDQPKKLNPKINLSGYTTTQPCIATNGANGYVLYFVSDRPGGKGKLDIWRSYRDGSGTYSDPENLSEVINTYDDDATPFYYPVEQALYFSSKGKAGLGGYDIFRAAKTNNDFTTVANIGYPLNSSVDDLYFTFSENDTTGLFTSNRPGSMFLKGETCCYDIYTFKFTKENKVNWLYPKKIIAVVDTVKYKTKIAELDFEFPLKLYFENDQPDPRTTATVTDKRYDLLYTDYIKKQEEYKTSYTAAFKKQEREQAENEMNDFFETDVKKSYTHLDSMCAFFLRTLSAGKTIKIKIRGVASPLAASFYNFNLSERRIASMINYFDYYNNGALKDFLYNKKTFVIEREPMGETESNDIDDRKTSKAFSVYSPNAGLQRYIEIMSVAIE